MIASSFENYLLQKDFVFIHAIKDGRIRIYESQDYKIKIGKDYNGFISIELKRMGSEFDWIEVIVLRSYLLNTKDYLGPENATELEIEFIEKYFPLIDKALDNENYKVTLLRLDAIKKQRARDVFGFDM